MLATRGHSQSLVLEATTPGSDLSFFKLDYRGQMFKPITNDYTLRLHTELGYGDGFGSTSGLPFYENYYAGGFNSVRGFKDNTLGPRSTPSQGTNPGTSKNPDQDPLPFGGNVLIQGGVELLFPLPFVKDQRSLRTSVFWDVGNVFNSNCSSSKVTATGEKVACNDIGLDGLASSVGLGVTWITALGPLSFSLAMPIKEPDDAETQVFQFSLGQTF